MCIPIIIIDLSVTNPLPLTCYSNCGLVNLDGDVVDMVNPSDMSDDDFNGCCDTSSTTSGYGITGTPTCIGICKFCYNHYISLHIPATYILA